MHAFQNALRIGKSGVIRDINAREDQGLKNPDRQGAGRLRLFPPPT